MSDILWDDGWPCHDVEPPIAGYDRGARRYTEREADALLCERVLGWTRPPLGSWRDQDGALEPQPDFAHDIRAAMLLFEAHLLGTWVEKLRSGGYRCGIPVTGKAPVCVTTLKSGLCGAIRLASMKVVELMMQETGK